MSIEDDIIDIVGAPGSRTGQDIISDLEKRGYGATEAKMGIKRAREEGLILEHPEISGCYILDGQAAEKSDTWVPDSQR